MRQLRSETFQPSCKTPYAAQTQEMLFQGHLVQEGIFSHLAVCAAFPSMEDTHCG